MKTRKPFKIKNVMMMTGLMKKNGMMRKLILTNWIGKKRRIQVMSNLLYSILLY